MQACYHFISCNSSTDIKFLNFFYFVFSSSVLKRKLVFTNKWKKARKIIKRENGMLLIFLRSSFFFLVVHRTLILVSSQTISNFKVILILIFLSFVFSIIIRRRFLSDFFVKNGGKFSNYFFNTNAK